MGSYVDRKTAFGLLEKSIRRSKSLRKLFEGFALEVKILSLSSFVYVTPFAFALFEESIEKMAGDSTSTVKSVNPHPLRIDVVKFETRTTSVCGGVR